MTRGPRRRANGQGTVFFAADKNRWIGMWHDPTGRRRKITGQTRDEVDRRVAEAIQLGGKPLPPPGDSSGIVRLTVSGHYVYELRNEAGTCVYVGVSSNIFRRIHSHWYNRTKKFGDEVASVVIHSLPTRTAAEMRELELIALYRPRYNTKGNP